MNKAIMREWKNNRDIYIENLDICLTYIVDEKIDIIQACHGHLYHWVKVRYLAHEVLHDGQIIYT